MAIVKVRELVCAFEKCANTTEANRIATECALFLQNSDTQSLEGFHAKLCASMCRVACVAEGQQCGALLQAAGEDKELSVIVENISTCPTVVAAWLSRRTKQLFSSTRLIFEQCRQPVATLTPLQEHVIGCLCRIPDLISNALKHSTDPGLLPTPLFTELAHTLMSSLDLVYQAIRAGVSCSTVFPAALIGKLALLGQKDVVMPVVVAGLEGRTEGDPLWERIAQALFQHIPDSSLESVLDAVMAYTNLELLAHVNMSTCAISVRTDMIKCDVLSSLAMWSHPAAVRRLLGDLVLLNPKAKFLLTHKAFLVKVPSRRQVLFNLVGYLSGDKLSRALLVEALLALLDVWGNASSLRHMDHRQHMWLSQLLMLSCQHLDESDITPVRPKLQCCVMAAIQTHIDSPVTEIRHVGMVVGEQLMNWLHPGGAHPLAFEYEPSAVTEELRKLARPSAIREEVEAIYAASTPPPPPPPSQTCRFGEGLVKTAPCTDVDSDDDLVPYAFGEDPDSDRPAQPRYLRTCLAALVSPDSPAHFQSALEVAGSLVRALPPDLAEVTAELTRVLLHLSDNYALDDFTGLRHRAMVALAVCSPQQAVPYLTAQLYAANYSIRQRIDILEVISAAALELSAPQSSPQASIQSPAVMVLPSVNRPWEGVVRERLKAKTRVISKGPVRAPPTAVPSRFAPVAPLFFFPLMCGYDQPLNTLDLLGADSLVLGSLLHTLGVVIHAATHAPLLSRMAAALMDFVWALRYHPNIYVRQGILFAMAMMLEATHGFVRELEDELAEVVQWLNDVAGNDSDEGCRGLARQSLAILKASLQELTLNSQ